MSLIEKFFSKNSNNNRLSEKAHKLVDVVYLTVTSCQLSILVEFPQLSFATQLKHWNFLSTILATHNALNHLHDYANPSEVEKIKKIVIDDLLKLYPQGLKFFQDLEGFIRHAESNPIDVGGLWLLWNLTEKTDIGNDHAVASKLNSVFSSFNTFWSPDSVFASLF